MLLLPLIIGLGFTSTITTEADNDNVNHSNEVPSGIEQTETTSGVNLGTCIFCYENPIDSACVPCGHMAGCMDCMQRIIEASSLCPNCRTQVASVIRVFTT
jgi:Zinc finger, C3HC4 type (RING finger)